MRISVRRWQVLARSSAPRPDLVDGAVSPRPLPEAPSEPACNVQELSRLELADRLAQGGYSLSLLELAQLVEKPLKQLETKAESTDLEGLDGRAPGGRAVGPCNVARQDQNSPEPEHVAVLFGRPGQRAISAASALAWPGLGGVWTTVWMLNSVAHCPRALGQAEAGAAAGRCQPSTVLDGVAADLQRRDLNQAPGTSAVWLPLPQPGGFGGGV